MSQGSTITFWGGLRTIGGTKVVIQEGVYRVLFDFGLAVPSGGDPFDDRLRIRPGSAGLRDLLAHGMIPPLDGLYSAAGLEPTGLKPAEAGESTQVFISHLHLDHVRLIPFLDDAVPVWMHPMSVAIHQAQEEGGKGAIRSARPVRAWEPGRPQRVGPITVTPVEVDHDIPGASGLIIETSSGTIAYSGDVRVHGMHPERTVAFMEAARQAGALALLLEGTSLGRGDPAPGYGSEPSVRVRAEAVLADSPALGICNFYHANLWRIDSLRQAAMACGRELALEPGTANIWLRTGGTEEGIRVYLTGAEMPKGAWMERMAHLVATPAEVSATQEKFLVQVSYENTNEIGDLKPRLGSVYIHSDGNPLSLSDPAQARLMRWLEIHKVVYCPVKTGGHAEPDDLHRLAEIAGCRYIFPIHSRSPELLAPRCSTQILPKLGHPYSLARLNAGRAD